MHTWLARNWWLVEVRGVLALLVGILTFAWPLATIEAFVFLFGIYSFLDGAFALAAAVAGNARRNEWWALLLEGLIGLALGVVAFASPGTIAVAAVFVVAFWAIVTGVLEIGAAVRLRTYVANELWLLLSGVVSILFGAALFVAPGPGLVVLTWLFGIYSILFGVTLIVFGFRVRSWAGRTVAG